MNSFSTILLCHPRELVRLKTAPHPSDGDNLIALSSADSLYYNILKEILIYVDINDAVFLHRVYAVHLDTLQNQILILYFEVFLLKWHYFGNEHYLKILNRIPYFILANQYDQNNSYHLQFRELIAFFFGLSVRNLI